VPEISLPYGRNSDRCDLIALLLPPPAALRLFAYRLRLAHSEAADCRSRIIGLNLEEMSQNKKESVWTPFVLAPLVGLEPTTP